MMAQHDDFSMDLDRPLPLLGGLSPKLFMRRHWQKKPLLVRRAIDVVAALVTRAEMFALAARDDAAFPSLDEYGIANASATLAIVGSYAMVRCRGAPCRRWRDLGGLCWSRGWTCMSTLRRHCCRTFVSCRPPVWMT